MDGDIVEKNQTIYNFLVALTRAKRKAILLTPKNKRTPEFLEWISGKKILPSNV